MRKQHDLIEKQSEELKALKRQLEERDSELNKAKCVHLVCTLKHMKSWHACKPGLQVACHTQHVPLQFASIALQYSADDRYLLAGACHTASLQEPDRGVDTQGQRSHRAEDPV